jgi:hypothetical protein
VNALVAACSKAQPDRDANATAATSARNAVRKMEIVIALS